jgi:hypothetical protein
MDFFIIVVFIVICNLSITTTELATTQFGGSFATCVFFFDLCIVLLLFVSQIVVVFVDSACVIFLIRFLALHFGGSPSHESFVRQLNPY